MRGRRREQAAERTSESRPRRRDGLDYEISDACMDVALWPGPICDVCYAVSCASCGYVFDDVSDASPRRTHRHRLLCYGCADAYQHPLAGGAAAAAAGADGAVGGGDADGAVM